MNALFSPRIYLNLYLFVVAFVVASVVVAVVVVVDCLMCPIRSASSL